MKRWEGKRGDVPLQLCLSLHAIVVVEDLFARVVVIVVSSSQWICSREPGCLKLKGKCGGNGENEKKKEGGDTPVVPCTQPLRLLAFAWPFRGVLHEIGLCRGKESVPCTKEARGGGRGGK